MRVRGPGADNSGLEVWLPRCPAAPSATSICHPVAFLPRRCLGHAPRTRGRPTERNANPVEDEQRRCDCAVATRASPSAPRRASVQCRSARRRREAGARIPEGAGGCRTGEGGGSVLVVASRDGLLGGAPGGAGAPSGTRVPAAGRAGRAGEAAQPRGLVTAADTGSVRSISVGISFHSLLRITTPC